MSGIIFDTSVYINALRQNQTSMLALRTAGANEASQFSSQPLYLSAVVLEELYVGASGSKIKKLLAKLEHDFEKIGRLLVPNQTDWTRCGQVLNLIGQRHGFEPVKRARMTNDTLIALTAARSGLTVITHNAADFKIISEFRSFNWREI